MKDSLSHNEKEFLAKTGKKEGCGVGDVDSSIRGC